MTKCDQQDTLFDYSYGHCTPAERAKFEEHLLTCASCANDLESNALLQGALDTWTPVDLPVEETRREEVTSPLHWSRPRWWQSSLQPLAVAATLVVIIGGLIGRQSNWWQTEPDEIDQQAMQLRQVDRLRPIRKAQIGFSVPIYKLLSIPSDDLRQPFLLRGLESADPNTEPSNVTEMFNRAQQYDFGEDGRQEDNVEAVRRYRLAALEGLAAAQYRLGYMYDYGEGVPEDDIEAVRWYRLAAKQGDADAQLNLGAMYDEGAGVLEDDAEAVVWYRLAAEQGDSYAQFNLGYMYDYGEGVQEDDIEAVQWYRLAAKQGDADAQVNLGYMYDKGLGVPEDDSEAVQWYRLAAEQGDEYGLYNLGEKYMDGEGMPEDLLQAYMLFTVVLTHISDDERDPRLDLSMLEDARSDLNAVSALLTSEQLTEAEKLVHEWIEAHPRQP